MMWIIFAYIYALTTKGCKSNRGVFIRSAPGQQRTVSVQLQGSVGELIPVKPEKQHLQEEAVRAGDHEQQGKIDAFGLQEKPNDVNGGRETQRGQDQSGDEAPHDGNPALLVGQTTPESWWSDLSEVLPVRERPGAEVGFYEGLGRDIRSV